MLTEMVSEFCVCVGCGVAIFLVLGRELVVLSTLVFSPLGVEAALDFTSLLLTLVSLPLGVEATLDFTSFPP